MANRAQTYASARQAIRAEKAVTRKEMKRERKRKIMQLQQYRGIYLKLIDLAMLGTQIRCSFGLNDVFDSAYTVATEEKGAVIIWHADNSHAHPWNTKYRDLPASDVRNHIRQAFINKGLKPWQLDHMEKAQ